MAITFLVGLVVGFTSLFLFLLWRSFWWPSVRLPPGPRPLPIVGNLLLIRKYESIQSFANDMKRKYGPIVTFWAGSKPVVLISGPDIIQEAMITQGTIFQGRSYLESTRIMNFDNRNLTGHGKRHQFLTKLLTTEILSKKRVAAFGPIRDREVNILIESFKKSKEADGESHAENVVQDFRSLVRFTVCNMLMGLLFGRRLTPEEYVEVNELFVQRSVMAKGKLRDFIPLLALLPDVNGVNLQLTFREKCYEVFTPLIEERKKALRSGKTEPETFVDTLVRLQGGVIESPIEMFDQDIVSICVEFLAAGLDPTTLNLEYCIANIIKHPEIEEKMAKEISACVGERLVDEEDIPRLPLLDAVVKEALRRHPTSPLAISRRALSDTKLAGYDIPMNTTVLQHLEAVALSSQIWEDSLEFRPERFLNNDKVDITGSTEISMIPFGVGRRMCPAVNIAFLHEHLILARLIQAFEWKPSDTPRELLDVSSSGGGRIAPMRYPLVAVVKKRSMASS